MRKIVFEYKYKNTVETFSPDWFLLSLNPKIKIATLIDKTTFKKRKFLYSHEVINPDEIRITVIDELGQKGGEVPPQPNKNSAMEGTTNAISIPYRHAKKLGGRKNA